MKIKSPIAALAAFTLAGAAILGGSIAAQATVDVPVTECVPSQGSDAWDETIVDAVAYDETIVDEAAHWQRYSWTDGDVEGDIAPEFPGEGWQANVAGDPHNIGVAGAYFVSHGSSGKVDWFYLEWVPEITHVQHHDEVSHVVHHDAVPPVICEEDPETATVGQPKVKDLCGTSNDHYGLPEVSEGATVERDGLDLVANLETGFVWAEIGAGWVAEENSLRFAFNSELFTDEPCTEPPVKNDEFEWLLQLPLCGESTVAETGVKTSFSYTWENEAWVEIVTTTPVERIREVELVECPVDVVPVAATVVDLCGTANDKVTAPADTDEIDYTLTDGNVLFAEAKEGFVIAEPGEGDKYTLFAGIATFEAPVLTNTACPEQGLAFTGGEFGPWPLVGGIGILAGLALFFGAFGNRRGWFNRA